MPKRAAIDDDDGLPVFEMNAVSARGIDIEEGDIIGSLMHYRKYPPRPVEVFQGTIATICGTRVERKEVTRDVDAVTCAHCQHYAQEAIASEVSARIQATQQQTIDAESNLDVAKYINRDYGKPFDKNAKIGTAVSVRLPDRFIPRRKP